MKKKLNIYKIYQRHNFLYKMVLSLLPYIGLHSQKTVLSLRTTAIWQDNLRVSWTLIGGLKNLR